MAGIDGRRGGRSEEGDKIGERDDAAFMVLFRSVLNQGVDRDDEESAHKTKRAKKKQHLKKTQPLNRDGECEHRHANGAKRDKAIFDLSSREQPRCVAPQTDANGERRLEIAAATLLTNQAFAALKNH